MTIGNRIFRLFAGLTIVLLTLLVVFSLLLPLAHRWGATPEEIQSYMPGDELLDQPLVDWTNAITIDAPPEKVWPWIIQIGENRGGYYSYTWIENAMSGEKSYTNASTVHPEFQNPPIGETLISGMLELQEVQQGQYMLAGSFDEEFGWTWVWSISPAGEGQTRLVIRNHVQPFTGAGNPAMTFFLDVGGFAMEQRMMQGIKLRAEGYSEPAYLEMMEYVLWLGALLTGLAAGILFLLKKDWKMPLLIGIASVVVLPVFLIVQPPVWIRAGIDLILVSGLAWSVLPGPKIFLGVRLDRQKQSLESA